MKFTSAFFCSAMAASAAVYLEPNRGQADIDAAFLARTPDGTVAVAPSALGLRLRDGSRATLVLEDASPRAHAVAERPLEGVSHYVRGRDPAGWIWDVPHYAAVRYREVYPGIDLVYHASGAGLEFDFVLAPGADPSRIRLRLPAGVRIDPSGALALGGALLRPPVAWQTIGSRRMQVPARFRLDRRRASVQLGAYDPGLQLTIDPIVQFATFLGGRGSDIGERVIAGPDGAIYTAGNTLSTDFPASTSPGSPVNRPGLLFQQTSYVARLKSDASALDWSLFIGGSARQSVFALKADSFGNLYLLGGTTSPNFPIMANAWRSTIDPSMTDLFLVKFDAQTGRIKTSTFLGIALYQNNLDAGAQLAIDAAGGIYVGGYRLYGGRFTPTPSAFGATTPSSAFVLRLNAAMNAVVYASYWPLGSIAAMDVDAGGNLTLGGVKFGSVQGANPPFPAVNPLPGVNQSPVSPAQAYIAVLNPGGTALTFATLLHGDGNGSGVSDLKIAPDGAIHVAGWSSGTKFPQVSPLALDPYAAAYQSTPDNSTDSPFLAKLAAGGKSLLQSTFFSGSPYSSVAGQGFDTNFRLALQTNGLPCLAGLKMPLDFQTAGSLVGTANSNPYGAQIVWSITCADSTGQKAALRTGLPATGGSGYTDIAVTADGGLLLTGSAGSTFTTTPGVVQPMFGGTGPYSYSYSNVSQIYPGDAFLLRVTLDYPAPAIQRISPDTTVLDTATTGACSVAILGSGFTYGASVKLNGQPASYSFVDSGHATVSFDCAAPLPGDNHISMTVPTPGGGFSDNVFTGLNAPPNTISVSPSSVRQGAGETKVVIRATNLTAGSTLYWNGSPRAAAFVLDGSGKRTGHFELLLEPPELAQPGSAQVSAGNPGPGGGVSPSAYFAVQPASGTRVPVLNTPNLLVFGPATPLGPKVAFSGSGFTSATRAFWDGVETPVTAFGATSITIQPPSGDLSHIGAHVLYAVNGSFQSATVRLFVGRAVAASASAYDQGKNRLYVVSLSSGSPPYSNNAAYDLLVMDGATGELLHTASSIVSGVRAAALSGDGRYLYLAGSNADSLATIVRYDTALAAVDLQWQIPPAAGQTQSSVSSILTPPDSAETAIVATSDGRVAVYDGDWPRRYDSAGMGLPVIGAPFFASANRIFSGQKTASGDMQCWTWLDYDAFGISGGQTTCGDAPPEVQHDSGLTYLQTGDRVYAASLLPPLTASVSASYPQALTADPAGRHAWQFSYPSSNTGQVVDYSMDARQLQTKAQFAASSWYSVIGLYAAGGGALLLVMPSYLLLLP